MLVRNPALPHLFLSVHVNGAVVLHNLEKKLPLATIVPPQSLKHSSASSSSPTGVPSFDGPSAFDTLVTAAAWEQTEGDLLALLSRKTCTIMNLEKGETASFTAEDLALSRALSTTSDKAKIDSSRQLAFLSLACESDIVAVGTSTGSVLVLYVSGADDGGDGGLALSLWTEMDTGLSEKIRHVKIVSGHLFALRADGLLCHWTLLPSPEETAATFSAAQLPLDRITAFDLHLDPCFSASSP